MFRRIPDDRSRRRGGRFVSLRCHSATLPAPRQLCQGGFAASGIGGVQKVSSAWIAPLLPARPRVEITVLADAGGDSCR